MPIFLDEDMFGCDVAVLGYPHVLICMAFQLRTPTGLWGAHLTDAPASPPAVTAFWAWATGKGLQPAQVTDMYGVCNHRVRYNATGAAGRNAWTLEMQGFANQIGWHGPAHGFDTGIIAPVDGTYVEYRQGAPGAAQPCQIFYKRNEKTQKTGDTVVPLSPAANVVSFSQLNNALRASAMMQTGIVGKVSTFHSGVFHEVNYAQRLFTVMV